MSLRHALLGLLAAEPATGYDLAAKFDRSLGNAWHAKHSQIYPELARMQADGQVEVVHEGARNSRTWALTPAGRQELRRWLVDVEPTRTQRNEVGLRMFLVPQLLDAEDARTVLERELDYVLAFREQELEPIARLVAEGGHRHPFAPAVDFGLRFSHMSEGWLRDQLARLEGER